MELSQKRTCNGCRVYSPTNKCCTIGYRTHRMRLQLYATPEEKCPKPKTVSESVAAIQYMQKH